MKMQRRTTAALAAFVFGCSMFMSASAAINTCTRCWNTYDLCVAAGTSTQCETNLITCLKRGDGTRPCPL
ncbi:hypothetical protein [Lysobacter capsici]|uniref:hypothetical protein n=1 Tax=Lysobacter capsici TaxID=435897 RepID=UPI00287B868E|nr:hypothetical protein [Lysobacter capsici]WND80651.1 hypothetical protein RJ610_25800 [Lysobacter capsici]WND85847.1 hypothetical protein RJ609_25820 [Lysobacter capsici]